MSDISQGPDWWLGTDGKWYPPAAPAKPSGAPTAAEPPPPGAPTPPARGGPPPPPPGSPMRPPPQGGGYGPPPHAPAQAGWPAPGPSSAPKQPGGNRTAVVIVVAVAAIVFVGLIVAVAAVTFLGKTTNRTVTGTFTLYGSDISTTGGCHGINGYDDIREGGNVTLKDGDGKILATSSLTSPSYTPGACEFDVVLDDVPDSDFYEFTVTHRGGLTYSRDDLAAQDWEISASIGDD